MADYTLTVYGDDDTTALFEVGTAGSHPHPYLKTPEAGKSAEVDIVRGTASIGQQDVEIIDPQTGATQSDRWLTALLGDAAGNSALNGRRAVLAQVSPAVTQERVIAGVALLDGFGTFKVSLRDIRERGVKLKVFTRTRTTSVLPRGVVDGYGQLPSSLFGPTRWIAPPTVPLTGTYDGNATSGSIALDGAPSKPGATIEAALVVTDAMRAAMRMRAVDGVLRFDQVEVWWRAAGTGTWVEAQKLANIRAPRVGARVTPSGYTQYGDLVLTQKAKVRGADGQTTDVLGAREIAVDNSSGGTLPTDGQAVEVVIVYAGEPSDQYPFHYEGTWGEFTRNLLRGDYGAEDEAGTAVAPRLRYDEAALLAIDTPVRVRLTEPKDDLQGVLEDLCLMVGAAPAVDDSGQIVPILSAVPDASVALAQIDDTNAQALAGWEHPTTGSVTQVTVTYPRDRGIPADRDPNGERSAGDGITSDDVTILQRAPAAVLGVMGVRDLKIDAWAFRALGDREGDPISGDVTDETGAQVAHARQHLAIDRFAYGGVSSTCRILASDFPGLKLGDWVIDARSWRPNYATGTRGGNSLAQVVSVKQPNPSWLEVRLIDAAPSDNPAAAPTLGTVTAATSGVVSVPVDVIPAGEEARVDYALSATTPTANSGVWTFLGRTDAAGTLTSPAFPVGATVWIRARGEAVGKRPSAWSTPVSVVIGDTPRVLSASVKLGDDGTPAIAWEVNPSALGMRLYYEVHDPSVDPALTSSLDFDATAGTGALSITAQPGEAVTVDFEPWTGWDGSAASGTAGERVRQTAVRTAVDASYDVFNLRLLADSDAATCDQGALVQEVWGATQVFTADEPTESMVEALQAAIVHLWDRVPGTLPITMPGEGQITGVYLQSVVMQGAVAMDTGYHLLWIYGTPAPLDFSPSFSQSGSDETLTLTITDPRGVAGTPLLSLDGAAGASMTAGSPGVWTSTYTLDPKHNRVIRVTVPRTDGGESIVLGPWTADVDTQAEVVSVSVSYNGAGVATVQAQFDTDTAVGAGNAEFSQSLTVWTPATVDSNLRASFTVAQENDQALTVYVRGKHADGTPGLEVPVGIDRFVPRLSAAPSFSQSGSDETLTLTLSDPSGVAGPPTVSLDGAAEVSMTDGGGGVWSTTYTLDAKHNRTIRATVPRTDGEPSLVLGPWTSDIDATADVVDSSVAYDGAGTATVSATFDTDTTAGVGQAEYSDDDGGNWTAFDVDANRRGSFSYTQSTSATTTLLVRGKAGSAAGTPVQVVVSKYVPLSTYPGRILTIDVSNTAVGSCPTTTMQNRVDVVFRDAPAGSTWDLARLENGESVALVADHIAVTTGSHTDSVTGPSAEKYELPSVGGTPVQVSYRVLLYPATRTSTPGDVKESAALTQNRTVCS